MLEIRSNEQVNIRVYDEVKYEKDSKKIAETTYEAGKVTGYEVVKKTIKQMIAEGFDDLDDFGEYLILEFADGSKATFRNSYVDMFIR